MEDHNGQPKGFAPAAASDTPDVWSTFGAVRLPILEWSVDPAGCLTRLVGDERLGLSLRDMVGRRLVDVLGIEPPDPTEVGNPAPSAGQLSFADAVWAYWQRPVVIDGRYGGAVGAALDVSSAALQGGVARSELVASASPPMQATGRLAGGIAHDFNNLLTTILGHSELLSSGLEHDDLRQRHITAITRAAQRAATLTRQLLAFSRQQILRPERLNLNELTVGLTDMLHEILGKQRGLELQLSPDLLAVRADPAQLEQVLLHLAANARDAMADSGTLVIETANVELDDAYTRRFAGVPPGAYAMLAVSDNGCGMDSETRSHAFEPFFTTKPAGSGSGLGLSLVHGIVGQHGGHLLIYSEPGLGTTVKVYLPSPDAEPPAPRDQPSAEGDATILLVEDEPAVRALVREVLRSRGYQVIAVASAEAALELLSRLPEVDLLLTDIVLASMNGRQLATEVAERLPGVRIVFMSGYAASTMVHNGCLDPADRFLSKPFTSARLLTEVRQALGQSAEDRKPSS